MGACKVSFLAVSEEILYAFFSFLCWFILEQCIFDLCTIVFMKAFSLQLFFPSQRVAFFCSKNDFLDPCPAEGPIQSLSSVCLSISSSEFLSGMGCYFFQLFCATVDIWNIYNLTEAFFPGNSSFPKFEQILPKMIPRLENFTFKRFGKFCH